MEQQATSGPSQAREGAPLASIGSRAAARVLDSLLLGVVGSLTFWLAIYVSEPESSTYFDSLGWALSLAGAVYEIVLTKWRGQTLGKMAMRIRVVRSDRSSLPGWWSSTVRFGVPTIVTWIVGFAITPLGPETSAFVGFLIAPAVYLTAVLDRDRKGIHDKAAGTMVIADRPIPIGPSQTGSLGEDVG